MRIKEVPKRTLFSIPFHLSRGFTIGVKGYVLLLPILETALCFIPYRYGLITEQKKGSYRLFYDAGDQLEPVLTKTTYIDEVRFTSASVTQLIVAPAGKAGCTREV